MEHRTQFTFYYSYFEAILSLPKRQRGKMMEAVCTYALLGQEPELIGAEACCFKLIKPFLDAAWAKSKAAKKKEELRKQKKSSKGAKPVQTQCTPDAEPMQDKE